MIKESIIKLSNGENLTYDQAEQVMDEIMSGNASDVQISAYLTALSVKGQTIDEITASASVMRKHCIKIPHSQEVLEIVGTGGDHSNSFNISTTSAIIVSACGVPVAKHGNRAATSKCGSADVLEALGVNINISPEKSAELLEKMGLCFLFSQKYHTAMKYVAPVRRELCIRTVFNILGPISNPALPQMQLLGVFDKSLVEPLANVLLNLGVKSAMVVYGQDGLDEISICAPTTVCELKNGCISSYEITPEQFGFKRYNKQDLVGGDANENANIITKILSGEKGAKRDATVLNSAAALCIANKITLEQAIKDVENAIDSKKALRKLEQFIKLSNEVM